MSGIAFVVFVSLYFVRAGYGIFRTAQWGPSVNNKLGWILMEAPVFIVMFILWAWSGTGFTMPQYLFFLLFQLHYLQRSFVFPFLLKGKSRMPLSIMTMGIVFNILNGVMQAGGLFWFPNEAYASGLAYLSEPHALAGLFLFLAGMGINLHSDHVIRHLRKPGDTRPAAWVFVWWTAANLVPRANAIYHKYIEEFGAEAVGKRKRIIPYLY